MNNNYTKHAKLSIIAETSKVVIYSFKIENFKYLTEVIQNTLLSELSKTIDFDEENIEETKRVGVIWDKYKETLFNNKIEEQYDIRSPDDYKVFPLQKN